MKRLSLVLLCLLCALVVFTSCAPGGAGAPSAPPAADAAAPPAAASAAPSDSDEAFEAPRPSPGAAAAPAAPSAPGAPVGDAAAESESMLPLPILTPSDESGRRMIYTTMLELQTDELISGRRLILDTAGRLGGHHTIATVQGRDMRTQRPTERYAHFIFRIPTENLAEFLLMIENNFNILLLHQEAQDETRTYRQTASIIDELREWESMLQELLEETEEDDYDGIYSLQWQIRDVQWQIRNLETAQADLMEDVIYSTVEIELSEVILPKEDEPAIPLTPAERFNIAVSEGLGDLGVFFTGLLVVIIRAVPVLLIIAFFVIIIVIIVRSVNKRKRNNSTAAATDTQKEPGEENK